MPKVTLYLVILTLALAGVAAAQHGGKAEPKRIEFPAGRTSTSVTGYLSAGQEMEYVFSARAGQTVSVTNSSPSAFDFRIFSEEAEVETEFESSRTLTITLPADGDYNFFVRKKAGGARRARFSLVLSIK